ncbi:DUF2381 family protein [Archangium gephyra]|nr:DUF2381 family protein [Archangium gephyra]
MPRRAGEARRGVQRVCPQGRHSLCSDPAHSPRLTLQRPFSTPLHQARPLIQGPHSAWSLSWRPSPIPPDPKESGVVEWELTAQEARGPFTLKLWDERGMRLVTLGNMTFP